MPMSPPARVVWIEMPSILANCDAALWSPPARVVWIEISWAYQIIIPSDMVATREGGVD